MPLRYQSRVLSLVNSSTSCMTLHRTTRSSTADPHSASCSCRLSIATRTIGIVAGVDMTPIKFLFFSGFFFVILCPSMPHKLLSTDPGEELDDLLAFSRGVVFSKHRWHCIVSGGKLPPSARLAVLSAHMGSPKPLVFNELYESWNVVFYEDGNPDSVAKLPKADAFVNNGPLSSVGLEAVLCSLTDDATLYLVGSAHGGTSGGVNQNFADAAWLAFIEKARSRTIVDVGPEVTRSLRFPNNPEYFPPGSHIAAVGARSALMFAASRPMIPPKFAGLAAHIRLNESNRAICAAWRAEAALPADVAAAARAARKASEYVQALMLLHRDGGGKGDTPSGVAAQFALCELPEAANLPEPRAKNGGVQLTDDAWDVVRRMAAECFGLTYDVAALAGIEEPYAPGKYGFKPEDKMDANPGGVFADGQVAARLGDKLASVLRTLTPAYDLFSVSLADAEMKRIDAASDLFALTFAPKATRGA